MNRQSPKPRAFKTWLLLILFFLTLIPRSAYADDNISLIFSGVARTLFSVFKLPATMIADSTSTMFPFGLLTGVIHGTFQTVTGTVAGAIDIARGAAPYAKYMIFFV